MHRYKLVLISETFPPDQCGVADYVNTLAHQLSNLYDVHVITRATDTVKSDNVQGVTIHAVMRSKFYVMDVIKVLRQMQPDLVDIQLAYSLAANHLNRFNIISSLNGVLTRIFVKAKLVCTVHELSSYLSDGHSSGARGLYRKLRDYLATRLCDYYFCVDRRYLDYFEHDRKLFLPNFSNIPSLVHKTKVDSNYFLYFGTIATHKNIDHLLNLFSDLLRLEPDSKLFLVGGLTQGCDKIAFQQALAKLPAHAAAYRGYLGRAELANVMADCSYALFPFPVTDKNASVLAMLVNGLVVIAESHHETIFGQDGNNFYQAPKLTATFIQQVIAKTSGQMLAYKTYDQRLKEHVELRNSIYQSLLNGAD